MAVEGDRVAHVGKSTVATKDNTSRTSSGRFIPLTHCFLVLTKPSSRSNIKGWELAPLLVSKVLQQH